MNSSNSLGETVLIEVSDPWEFGSECGTGPFRGVIESSASQELIVRLAAPIVYRERSFGMIVLRPRHVGEEAESVLLKPTAVNMILLPGDFRDMAAITEAARSAGVALIGTVRHE